MRNIFFAKRNDTEFVSEKTSCDGFTGKMLDNRSYFHTEPRLKHKDLQNWTRVTQQHSPVPICFRVPNTPGSEFYSPEPFLENSCSDPVLSVDGLCHPMCTLQQKKKARLRNVSKILSFHWHITVKKWKNTHLVNQKSFWETPRSTWWLSLEERSADLGYR